MRVVILGGGFTAVGATQKLRGAIDAGALEATVVSRANFVCGHGLIAEMITGRVSPSHIAAPARRIFAPARMHLAEVERVDLERRVVRTSRKLDGAQSELEYDQLVVALGSVDRLELYPGLAEHSFKLRRYEDALQLKNHFLEMFELAEVERDPAERRRLLTFFIAGGGFSGSEVAGELADLATLLTKREYSRIDRAECRIVLVEPGPSILPEMSGAGGGKPRTRLVNYGLKHLRELGVEVRTGTFVTAASPNEVVLSTGERIPTRTIVSAVGSKIGPVVDSLDLPKDDRGRIVTRRTGQVEGRDEVWAGGESAAFPKPSGGTAPPNALYALMTGRLIGANLSKVARGRRPGPFVFPGFGQGVSIGRRSAVATLGPLSLTGRLAWVSWRLGILVAFPSVDRKLRLVIDWAIWPLVGRDISELRSIGSSDYELRHSVFQPGDVIAAESRTRRYIHVIVEGEVELVEAAPDGEPRVLRTIGPGEHFGIRWLDSFEPELARAKTVVRTLAIHRDHAPMLQSVLESAGRLVAESGHFPAITAEMEEAMKTALEIPSAGPAPKPAPADDGPA